MSSYAEKNLISGESIVLKAKINFLAIIRQIIWAVIMIVVAVVLGSNEALNAEGVEPIKTIVVAVCLVIGLMPLLIGILGLVHVDCRDEPEGYRQDGRAEDRDT